MSHETQEPQKSGNNRRRRSRGGSNRNHNNNERSERGPRDSRNPNNRSQSQGQRQNNHRAEEFRPQAPRIHQAPVKLSFFQKILKAIGLYKEPTPPARPELKERKNDSAKQQSSDTRPPKSNTRNARSNEGQPREERQPREKRPEGERSPRGENRKNRGGDPSTVESTRVYVGNLSYDVTEQDLQELFKGIGGVRNVEIVYNRSTHRSKGYGFVEMLRQEEAIRSVEVLHDQHFMGRKMIVSGAKSKGQDDREENDGQPERGARPVVLAPISPAADAELPVVAHEVGTAEKAEIA
ncbi:MAG: RNA-binding protein [Akkermansiaceae bacterium]|nr:RNA-binding protein [Akkermansiaceae bacterium]